MRSTFLILGLLMFTIIVATPDTEASTNNWCDVGGTWDDGRCGDGSEDEQDWHWMCGWYMAQINQGIIGWTDLAENVPLCSSLVPETIQIELAKTQSSCPANDSDCDGLPDAWELAYFGNLAQTATDDPDTDTCNNLCEYINGTAPI